MVCTRCSNDFLGLIFVDCDLDLNLHAIWQESSGIPIPPPCTYDKLPAFKWMGPDPLSMSTQASDMFFYMSAFAFPIEVHWLEFLLVRFDRKSGATTEEHLLFLPRVETTTWNLRRVRGQLLDAISWHGFGATGTNFRLSL
jgi:hypothetical protein